MKQWPILFRVFAKNLHNTGQAEARPFSPITSVLKMALGIELCEIYPMVKF